MTDQTLEAVLRDAASAMMRAQDRIEELENRIERYKADYLAQAQRAAELQAEVDRLEDEVQKVTKKLLKTRQTIRRMEEGEL